MKFDFDGCGISFDGPLGFRRDRSSVGRHKNFPCLSLADSIVLGQRLGFGRDGDVYSSNRTTAVKLFIDAGCFSRELRAYQVLAANQITRIGGHWVPQLRQFDEELMAIEMSIVKPPFLLDFASAYPSHEAPDFPEEVWEEWRQQKSEEFGRRWAEVEFILSEFRRLTGMTLLDVNPGNVKFVEGAARSAC